MRNAYEADPTARAHLYVERTHVVIFLFFMQWSARW
jgi:hypothetical protein